MLKGIFIALAVIIVGVVTVIFGLVVSDAECGDLKEERGENYDERE